LLGGDANAVSIARSLGRGGVEVYAVNVPEAPIRHSRYSRWISLGDEAFGPKSWERFLLGQDSDFLRGSVVFACSDDAIELVTQNWEELSGRFVLEEGSKEVRQCLLDKLCTCRKAREAGISTPAFWEIDAESDLERIATELPFPILVKPRISHEFWQLWEGRKFFIADNLDELRARLSQVFDRKMGVFLLEFIPGGDDKLCSYYTYMDEEGAPLCDFTKRVIRRFPENMGLGTYHITDWNPEVRELGLRFLRHVGLRGLGNIEFKRDERDGKLKIIECNARFTAANCLVTASGIDLAWISYNKLTGAEISVPRKYKVGLTLWTPVRDVRAFLELRNQGKITTWHWIRGILRPQVFAVASWNDPIPAVAGIFRSIARLLGKCRLGWIAFFAKDEVGP
jgi:predicted ATP-grasp superfamily ATP-dependent carboligase